MRTCSLDCIMRGGFVDRAIAVASWIESISLGDDDDVVVDWVWFWKDTSSVSEIRKVGKFI